MRAARVVADHAADRAVRVGGRVRREGEVVRFGDGAQIIKHNARLHTREAGLGVEFEDLVHVAREVDDDGDIASLAGKPGAATAAEDRRVDLTSRRDCRLDIALVARKDYPDGDLAVVRRVGGVHRASARVEGDLATDGAAQLQLEAFRRILIHARPVEATPRHAKIYRHNSLSVRRAMDACRWLRNDARWRTATE